MKTYPRHLVAMVAMALFAALSLQAADDYSGAGGFVRICPVLADPQEGGFDNGAGVLIQLGGSLDAADLMLEFGQVRFEQGEAIDFGNGEGYVAHGDLRVTPLLATARWRAKFSRDGRFSGLLGVSGGLSQLRFSGDATPFDQEEPFFTFEGDEWVWTFGADACLEYRVSPVIDLVLGVKYIVLTESEWNVEGYKVTLGEIKATAYYAGIGWRF